MSHITYITQTGHLLGLCNHPACAWQGACMAFMPEGPLGSNSGRVIVPGNKLCLCGCPAAVHIVRTSSPNIPASTTPTATASAPPTTTAPASSAAPQSSLRPPGATAAKPGFKDALKSFNEAAALRAARRDGNDVNPRTESLNTASEKKRKPSTSTGDGRSAESKRSRSASTQSKKVEDKLAEYRVVLVPRTRQVHEGRYQKPDPDVLNRLSEAGLALKISLAASSTPTHIDDRIRSLFATVFDDPTLSPSLSDPDPQASLERPWCLLLGEAAPKLGDKIKILRPTTRRAPVTMDDIDLSMTNQTQYRIEGGGSAWKRLFWIALGPHFPDIVLPTLDHPDIDFSYKAQYSDDEDAQEFYQAEGDESTASGDELEGDSEYKASGPRRAVSLTPPRKPSRPSKPADIHRFEEEDSDKPPRTAATPYEASHSPPPPSSAAAHEPSAATREPSPAVSKPLFAQSNSFAPTERAVPASATKTDNSPEPVPLDWEAIVIGIRSDLAGLWSDIRNICNPLDDSVETFFPLKSPPCESEWGFGLQAALDFDTLQTLLQPRSPSVPQDVVKQAKQLVDFGIKRLYPALHTLAFGNSGTRFGPYGLHSVVKSISRLLSAFHVAIPYRASSVLQLSAIIKRFHTGVQEFRSAIPRSSWDPLPFRRLQTLLHDEESARYLPRAKGKSAQTQPVVDGDSMPSPEDLRQRIAAYYGTIDDPMVFPSPLIALGPGGLDDLLTRAIHPFLDAPVALEEEESLSDAAKLYKDVHDILGTLCEALATRVEMQIHQAKSGKATPPPSPAPSVYTVHSNDSPPKPHLPSAMDIDSDSELTPPPPPPPKTSTSERIPKKSVATSSKPKIGNKKLRPDGGDIPGQGGSATGKASTSAGPTLRHRDPKNYRYYYARSSPPPAPEAQEHLAQEHQDTSTHSSGSGKPSWDWLVEEPSPRPEEPSPGSEEPIPGPSAKPAPPTPTVPSRPQRPRPRPLLPATRLSRFVDSLAQVHGWDHLCNRILVLLPHPTHPISLSELQGRTRQQQFHRLSGVYHPDKNVGSDLPWRDLYPRIQQVINDRYRTAQD